MSYHERIYGDEYYYHPEEDACPKCKEVEKNKNNAYELCDDCLAEFDRFFQMEVEREAEMWLKYKKNKS